MIFGRDRPWTRARDGVPGRETFIVGRSRPMIAGAAAHAWGRAWRSGPSKSAQNWALWQPAVVSDGVRQKSHLAACVVRSHSLIGPNVHGWR